MTNREPHRIATVKPSPASTWPLWKVVALGLAGYGPMSGFLYASLQMPPPIPAGASAAASILIVVLGVGFSVWSARAPGWIPRTGGGILIALLFLGVGLRFWAMVATGPWLWLVTLLFMALFVLAWFLPAISGSLSAMIWREQVAPQSQIGRKVSRTLLALGLGGAGVVGASSGMALARTGAAGIAYLLVALGMSIVGVLIAQGFSHQLWPSTPWGGKAAETSHDKNG